MFAAVKAVRRTVGVLAVSLAAVAAAPAVSSATPFYPTTSCWLIEYPPSNQCAGGGWIGLVDASFPPNTVPNTNQITIARFDGLSAIPSNAVVTDATLSVYQTDEIGSDPKEISIREILSDWDSSADWLWPWSAPGGDYGSTWNTFAAPGNNAWSDPADITALVAAWVDGSIVNYGVGLMIEGISAPADHAIEVEDIVLDVDYYVPS
jgi:hypothetical protein